tara:strand:+ start:13810 stop:15195 length:1386 start_codon:yes stop_codon:yes gene_type:complete
MISIDDQISNYFIKNSNKFKINSKEIKKNDIFIALKGSKYHGNRFINDSLKAGARYCITDKRSKYFLKNEKIYLVENVISYLRNLSIKKRALYNGNVIGITGSAGKTSLKEYLKFFLEKKYKVSASIKSYNNNLGVILSILNMNINSEFAIFEIGTNNFFEIRDLTKLVKPSQVFITNIQSTHLKNFKSKKNIAIEKSDIFNKKYNQNVKTLFFQMNSKEEKIINNIAKKQKIKNIIKIGNSGLDCFIKSIKEDKLNYLVNLNVLKKNFSLKLKNYNENNLNNLIYVLAFFMFNKINTEVITNNKQMFPQVEGRGSIHHLKINKKNIQLIDQSYNANPDTMISSIKHFSKINKKGFKKILILGNMNELGNKAVKYHFNVIQEIEKDIFDSVILSGGLFKKALNMSSKLKNKYVYRNSSETIMSYLIKTIHKKAIMMIKCSNSTEVNKLAKLLKSKMREKFV